VGALRSFAALLTEIAAAAERGSVADTIEYVGRCAGLLALWNKADDEDALANFDELVNAATEYDRRRTDAAGSLIDWLQQVSLVSDVDAINPEVGAVTLMTLHAAKGLEFDTVYVVGVEDGLLPHRRNDRESADIEEERRLCFVGMTRARRRLTLTCADWRERPGRSS